MAFFSSSPLDRIRGGNVRRRVPFYRRRWFALLVIFFLITGATSLAIGLAVIKPLREIAEALPLDTLKKIERSSIIHDRGGIELGRIYVMNRTPIKVEQVPMHFIHALTSEEDSRFYEHAGIDWYGVARAMYWNLRGGVENQGASTLTQQLARDAFKLKELEDKGKNRSRYKRKIVEAFLAARIEKSFSKSDILEMYLNRVYFGAGNYGVQAAAQGFFGKDVSLLNVEESASLCCLLKNPSGLNPRTRLKEHTRWRNHIFDRMHSERFITAQDAEMLKRKPVVLSQRVPDARLTYVYEEIRQQAIKIVGEEESQVGGFKIYTTIDGELQKAAEEALKKRLAEVENQKLYPNQTYAQYHATLDDFKKKLAGKAIAPDTVRPQPEYLQGAVLVVDNKDGGILALVGGRDFLDSQYNRALQSRRPAGTAFVPFVYATAFQKQEFFPPMQLEDGPIDNRRVMIGGLTGILGEWGTEQDETHYEDHISARDALVQGRNAATVRLGEQIGLNPVKELAARAGIVSKIEDYPKSFLGSSEVKLDEMCLAYSSIPNKGRRAREMSLIRRITDADGKVIYQVKEDADDMVLVMDEIAAYQTHSCLADVLDNGTGKPARAEYGLQKFPAGGKTGTHYEFKDLWFVGYSSSVTCGVWCGFDQQKPIYTGAYSNRIALPVWVDVMNASIKDHAAEEMTPPPEAQLVEVCKKTGLRATDGCFEKVPDAERGGTKSVRATYKEVLRPRTVFDLYCDQHGGGDALVKQFKPSEEAVDMSLGPVSVFASAMPVRMQGLTVLGADPYKATTPVIKAEPLNPDGSTVKRAIPVEDETQKVAPPPIKLAPPPPLKVD
jgi:membrane peptidoglycan carboxypeptidase